MTMSYQRVRLSFLETLDLGLVAVQTGKDISGPYTANKLNQ